MPEYIRAGYFAGAAMTINVNKGDPSTSSEQAARGDATCRAPDNFFKKS